LAEADASGQGLIQKRHLFETVLLSTRREWERKLLDWERWIWFL
jgi:hypothetical protein